MVPSATARTAAALIATVPAAPVCASAGVLGVDATEMAGDVPLGLGLLLGTVPAGLVDGVVVGELTDVDGVVLGVVDGLLLGVVLGVAEGHDGDGCGQFSDFVRTVGVEHGFGGHVGRTAIESRPDSGHGHLVVRSLCSPVGQQPLTMTVPWMSRHGGGVVGGQIGRAHV